MVRGGASRRGMRGGGSTSKRGNGTNIRKSVTIPTQEEIHETASNPTPSPTAARDDTHTPLHEQDGQDETQGHEENNDNINPSLGQETLRSRGLNQGFDAPINAADRRLITLNAENFTPVSVTRNIGIIVREWMRGPWIRWKHVPVQTQNEMWNAFQEKFTWEQPTEIIKEAFFRKAMQLYSNSLYQARVKVMKDHGKSNISETKGLGPSWIRGDFWDEMVALWAKQEWQDKSEISAKNRKTEKDGSITKHTCGSIPIAEHRLRLAKEKGREPTYYEVYNHVHMQRPKDKESVAEYVDPKSKRVCTDYTTFMNNKYGTDASSHPGFDAESWIKATGSPKKGRVYGFGTGQHAKSIMKSIDSATSGFPSESSSVGATEIQRVREEVREEVRQELQQEMQDIRKSNTEMEERIRAMERMMLQMQQQGAQSQPTSSPLPE